MKNSLYLLYRATTYYITNKGETLALEKRQFGNTQFPAESFFKMFDELITVVGNIEASKCRYIKPTKGM